ncbi:MAG: putative DNA-binding domain-containing protein, partial [Planctomycetes bacterium]|nr:putative DNA-binding domain-containing protein [Planctomycetota bacterium]
MSDVAASSLRALQRTFAAALRGPTSGASRRRPRLRLAGADRMHVYVDAYAARLVEVLAGDYGAVRSLLGEQSFERLARAYVRAHPSRHPNLNVFGRHFPAFLRRQRGLAANVGQVARLELALARAFDAPAAPPLVVDTLATTPAHRLARARLHVHPSVQLLRLPAAAVDAYAAWRSGAARTGAARP